VSRLCKGGKRLKLLAECQLEQANTHIETKMALRPPLIYELANNTKKRKGQVNPRLLLSIFALGAAVQSLLPHTG